MPSIQDTLSSLENQIGTSPHLGSEIIINEKNRKHVISWLTIKGLNNVRHNNDSTLGKLYGIPNYFSVALDNQKYGRGSYQKRKPDFSYEVKEEEIDLESETNSPPLESIEGEDLNPKQLQPLVESISRKIIHQNLTQELINNRKILEEKIKDLKSKTSSQNENTLNRVAEILKEQLNKNNLEVQTLTKNTAEEIVKEKVKQEIKNQNDELKKLVESIIFQTYLDQKLKNETQEVLDKEINSTEINPSESTSSSSFIPKIDPNYHFDPYATKVIRSALSMQENLYVYGDTGCGKTTHLEQVCAVLNRGLIRINPHDGITREMFLGGMKLINNETIFVEGALPLAMRNGFVFLVDEISFLPPNLTAILNPIAEKGGKLYLPETSEWISPHPNFCIFATDNTGGKGDRTGNYTGTEVQNTATLDRFAFCLKMDYLPVEKEQEMLIKRFPNQNDREIERMVRFATEIRSAFSRGELSLTLSTRKLIKFFSQRENNFSIQEALSNTILSWLDEDDETLIKTIIDRLDLLNTSSPTQPRQAQTNFSLFQEHLRKNEKVFAIRIYRRVYDCDLRTAKDAVEEIINGGLNLISPSENPKWSEIYHDGVSQ